MIQQKIVEIGQRLHQRGWLAAADGNISFRISDDEILITPSGVHKGYLDFSMMAAMKLDGTIVSGKPSSERLMHLEVYRRCPAAKAVVHAHPPHAIAWTVARPELKELPANCLSEVILAVGRVPVADYARPGTAEMGSVLVPHLPHSRVMILARHGALSWGEDMDEAYNGIERLEHSATILKLASDMGPLTELPKAEVEYLIELRRKIGPRTL